MAQLHINQLKGMGKRSLDDDPITIGRSTQNGLVLAHSSVSREHCRLETTDGVTRIRDLKSRHGTKVNGQAIDEVELFDGDVITIGIFEIVYQNTDAIREIPIDEIDIFEDGEFLDEAVHPDATDATPPPVAASAPDVALVEEMESLKQQLREKDERISLLEMEEAGLKQGLDDIQEEAEEQKQRAASLELQLEENTQAHVEEIQTLERANQELQNKQQASEKESLDHSSKLEKISLELETTDTKLSETVSQLSAHKKELETLSAALKKSRQANAARDQTLANIRAEAQQLFAVSQQLTAIQQGLQALETVYVETDEWVEAADQSDPEAYEKVVTQQAAVGVQLEAANGKRDEATIQLQQLVEQYCRNIAGIPLVEAVKSHQKRSLLSRFTRS